MITGKVTANREAVISLVVHGLEDQEQRIEAIIDTGYNGFLTLPETLISTLGLAWQRRERALLADGSETFFDLYEATVLWDGKPRRVAIDAVETDSLPGMSMLAGYELKMEVIEGGKVVLEALTEASSTEAIPQEP